MLQHGWCWKPANWKTPDTQGPHAAWCYAHETPRIRKPTGTVKGAQSRLTFCDPMDYMVHGILQARLLEWVAFPFSRGSSQPRDGSQVSHIAGGSFTSWATREAQDFYEERIKKIFTCYSTRLTIFLLFHKWMATSISPPQVSTLQFQENFLQYLMEFFSMICRWLTPKSVFKTQILFKWHFSIFSAPYCW